MKTDSKEMHVLAQAVVDFVSARLDAGEKPAAAAAALLDACLAPDPRETRGIGCDNMTATIVLLHGTAGAAAAPEPSASPAAAGAVPMEGAAEPGGSPPAAPAS